MNATPCRSSLSATAGLVPDLKNPNFGEVAKAMDSGDIWSRRQASSRNPFRLGSRTQSGAAACGGETDAVGDATLALCFAGAVVGMAVYSAKALLHGKGGDWEMMAENIP